MSDDSMTPASEPSDAPQIAMPNGAAPDSSSGRRRKPWMTALGLVIACAVGAGTAVALTGGDDASPTGSDALRTRTAGNRSTVSSQPPNVSTTTVVAPVDPSRSTGVAPQRTSGAGSSATPTTVAATPTTVTTAALPYPDITSLTVTPTTLVICGPGSVSQELYITWKTVNAVITRFAFDQTLAQGYFSPNDAVIWNAPCQSGEYDIQVQASNERGTIIEGETWRMDCVVEFITQTSLGCTFQLLPYSPDI